MIDHYESESSRSESEISELQSSDRERSTSDINDSYAENSLSSSKKSSWIESHFEKVVVDGKCKRRCLSENCDKSYSSQSSHLVYRRHWHVDHKQSSISTNSDSDESFSSDRDKNVNNLIKLVIKGKLSYNLIGNHTSKITFLLCITQTSCHQDSAFHQ